MDDFVASLVGKKVVVFGVGRQGGGSGDAAYLRKHGAIVRLSDLDTTLAPEGQTKEQIDWAQLIIKNPGVPDDHPLMLRARNANVEIATSIALFVQHATIPVIGVTGTRGKSTTTALIFALLNSIYPHAVITGGNIPGTSGLSLLDQQEGVKFAVLELSSFQLHDFALRKVSPPYAVITNLYPDHLNRYPDMTSYLADKSALVQFQHSQDHCFFHADNEGAVAISQLSPATKHAFSASDVADWQTHLPGLHNRENLAAMWAVGRFLGISETVAKQVASTFFGLPFRQEIVRIIDGITFINDTTATTPVASCKAIAAFTSPTILIAGGATKNLPVDELVTVIATSPQIVGVVLLGSAQLTEFTTPLKKTAGDKILGQVDSMLAAIKLARENAHPGYNILLSPGFASFDLFRNEFDRGTQFNTLVKAL